MRRGRNASPSWRALIVLPLWLASMAWLWIWWLSSANSANLFLYIPLTFAIFYEYIVMPGAFIYFILKAKAPKKRKVLANKKVAVITPCVPAQESLAIIERQLKAMSEITYPHDSWILDEAGNKDIKKMARKYGVNYFTRKNIAKYNLGSYPFKAKTKAGNINAWLHKVRRKNYDFFVQLDIDHIPHPDYLDKTLGHFRDKKVGWVQAPSVYSNLNYWTARGSAEQDLGLQGPLQMAFYNNTNSPVIIGSHTTFRMSAIREINGFQPTRAEDHLNTLALMDKGWNGVYVPEIIAEGDGPETFNAYLSQQYAWAFSMFQILKNYSFPYLKNMTWRKRYQYIFIQTWYPLWSLSYFILFSIPVIGLLFNTYAINSNDNDFLYRFTPALLSILLLVWAGRPLAQPQNINFSWRGIILHVIRWPIILMAVISAGLGKIKPYQITPKGKFLRNVPTIKLYLPFLALSLVSALSILFSVLFYDTRASDGLLVFAITNLVTMLSVCLLDLNIRLRQIRLNRKSFKKYWLRPTAAVGAVLVVSSVSLVSAVYANQQVIYALVPHAAVKETKRNPAALLPSLLSSAELKEEISSKKYNSDTTIVPSIGIYSPDAPAEKGEPYIRHIFVDWREDNRLAQELLTTLRTGNTPFFTIEPKGEADGEKLLSDIGSGQHDQTIDAFLNTLSQTDNSVYVRFAHEMELAELYPWGNQDSELFISAYRHVTDRAKAKGITNIKWVWGPAGNAGAEAYYPGDDAVDIVGTTVLYDQYWYGDYEPAFAELVEQRQWLAVFNKPLWIVEFGAGNADSTFQQQLISDAVASHKDLGFEALVYLNIPDSNIDGPDYHLEDTSSIIAPKPVQEVIKPLPAMKPKPVMKKSGCDAKTSQTFILYAKAIAYPTDCAH